MTGRGYFFRARLVHRGADDIVCQLFTANCVVSGGYSEALDLLHGETHKHAERYGTRWDVVGEVFCLDENSVAVGRPDTLSVKGGGYLA